MKLTNELHDYVLNSNGLKSFEVVLLCIFSLSVSVIIGYFEIIAGVTSLSC